MNDQKTSKGGWQTLRNWLRPGLGIKRWMLVVLAGITLVAVGFAILLLDFYRTEYTNQTFLAILSYASLRFLPRILRVIIFGGIGVGILFYGIWGLNRAFLRPFMTPGRNVVDQLAEYHRRARGPRVVAIGGGHGLSSLLRGLKENAEILTATLSVVEYRCNSGRFCYKLNVLFLGKYLQFVLNRFLAS